ncbi:uncharacterized protein LOC130821353 [Amaranthus tricolor]|uniref:uncharacterized protein LOC130821353 n=1 Tax=Amaranthus tricolor TaxID=29722 RepID=UPI0025855363|nr:uncharacterized protein LOC130821353 [Amaranthus tricolor]
MSLEDVVNPPPVPSPPHHPTPSTYPSEDQTADPLQDEISIPNISDQILDYYDAELFQDLQNPKVTSNPNYYYYENQESSHGGNSCGEILDMQSKLSNQNEHMTTKATSTNNGTTTTATVNTITRSRLNNHQEIMLASQSVFDSDISNSIDFSITPQCNPNIQPDPYKLELSDLGISSGLKQYPSPIDPTTLSLISPLGPLYGDDSLSSIPTFSSLNPLASVATSSSSCSFHDPAFLQADINTVLGTAENSGILNENFSIPFDFKPKDLDFQADNSGIFSTDQLTSYNSGEMQAFSNENSQLVSVATSSAPINTEISSLDDSTFKVGKLSMEQRKEKIHRYLKKRNERNFNKKIKYACRKTLADSRPRVRGRFAKNDEYGDSHCRDTNNHDDDDDEELTIKEEDEMVESSDIFTHISGVNSFDCNYQHIQSWS